MKKTILVIDGNTKIRESREGKIYSEPLSVKCSIK